MSFSYALPEAQPDAAFRFCVKQRTLQRPVEISGIGIFTGEKSTLRLTPSEADTGVLFQRQDLPHQPFFPATLDYVQGTPRCTMLGVQGVLVQTVEHLLATLKAYQIDNVLVEIDGPEVPILDGSAQPFVQLIEKGGVCLLDEVRPQGRLEAPVYWSQNDTHLIAIPSDEYRISYTLHYPHCDLIGTQYYSFVVNEENFKEQIAPCRTFSLYEEIAPLIKQGFLKKGGLENGILIKDNAVANPGGLRFKDEMVRHKILDLIGDLSLMGLSFSAHVFAIRSGHASNVAFAKELAKHIKMENA